MDDLIAIARIARPRGLKGELVGDILTDFPERFEGLGSVTAVMPDGTRCGYEIEGFRFQNGRILLKLVGIAGVEAAEKLRGAEICVNEADAVDLEDDEFFDWELVGCRVETLEGDLVGAVREVMRTGGTENLIVAGEREYLIPFAESICVEVDIRNKLIRVDPPEGLLEF